MQAIFGPSEILSGRPNAAGGKPGFMSLWQSLRTYPVWDFIVVTGRNIPAGIPPLVDFPAVGVDDVDRQNVSLVDWRRSVGKRTVPSICGHVESGDPCTWERRRIRRHFDSYSLVELILTHSFQ